MKKILFTLVFLAFASSASAQVGVYGSDKECLANPNGPAYVPTTTSSKPLAAGEVVIWHQAGCADMEVPEIVASKKRGWAKIDAGSNLVADKNVGKAKRHAKCDNTVFEFVPFPSEVPTAPIREGVTHVTFEPVSGEIKHTFPDPIRVRVEGKVETSSPPKEKPQLLQLEAKKRPDFLVVSYRRCSRQRHLLRRRGLQTDTYRHPDGNRSLKVCPGPTPTSGRSGASLLLRLFCVKVEINIFKRLYGVACGDVVLMVESVG